MKCKICGAQLRKTGDICKECYVEYCKEEELERDIKENYKLYRKYVPSYQLTQYIDWYFVALVMIFGCISQSQIGLVILLILVFMTILGMALFLSKRKADNTICTFYDKKIVWKYGPKKKTLPYSNLKEITYYQNFFQKLFKLADIQFRPEVGSYLTNGFEVKNVSNFDAVWKEIQEIIISKKEN